MRWPSFSGGGRFCGYSAGWAAFSRGYGWCALAVSVAVFSNRATAVHVNAPSLGACNNSVFSTLTSWYALPHAHLDAVYTASASGVTHRPGQVNRSLYSPTLIVSPAAAYAVVPTDGACLPRHVPVEAPPTAQELCYSLSVGRDALLRAYVSRALVVGKRGVLTQHNKIATHLIICPPT